MNGKAAKAKGVRAEQEVARIIDDLLGVDVRRTLAGHADDIGDLAGLADTTIEVKNLKDVSVACRDGVDELVKEQANAGTTFGVCFVRRRGGDFYVVMTPQQWATYWREATA